VEGVTGVILVEDRLAIPIAPSAHLAGDAFEMDVVDAREQPAGSQAIEAGAILGNGSHRHEC
jgi:hypothetical protein